MQNTRLDPSLKCPSNCSRFNLTPALQFKKGDMQNTRPDPGTHPRPDPGTHRHSNPQARERK